MHYLYANEFGIESEKAGKWSEMREIERDGEEKATGTLLTGLFSLRKSQFSSCEQLQSPGYFTSACGSSVNVQDCATGCGV